MAEERIGEEYDGKSLHELAVALGDLQSAHKFHNDAKIELQKKMDVLTMSIIPEMMADQDPPVINLTIEDVGRLQTKADAWVSVLAGDRPELIEWLRRNGHASMVTSGINANTLKAWVKLQVQNGEVYPTNLIKHEPYEKASLVKVKAKKAA